MRIGLIDIEPKIFNAAYMQISQSHKEQGDQVKWWSPLTDREFDHVYCSSLFDFTDKSEIPKRAICGGTGFDISSRLSQAMEKCQLDYSIYPECKTSYVWFSRGCVRDCPWCIVRQKEGYLKPVMPKNLNPKGQYITIVDNNFFANPLWAAAMDTIDAWTLPVEFMGIDVRAITPQQMTRLNRLSFRGRIRKQIKIAWDNPKENLKPKLKEITKHIKPYKLMCYVLIGFNSTPGEDLHRVETLRNVGIDPFVMPYNKKDPYQKQFAQWVNHKAIFKTVKWEDYKGTKS